MKLARTPMAPQIVAHMAVGRTSGPETSPLSATLPNTRTEIGRAAAQATLENASVPMKGCSVAPEPKRIRITRASFPRL